MEDAVSEFDLIIVSIFIRAAILFGAAVLLLVWLVEKVAP